MSRPSTIEESKQSIEDYRDHCMRFLQADLKAVEENKEGQEKREWSKRPSAGNSMPESHGKKVPSVTKDDGQDANDNTESLIEMNSIEMLESINSASNDKRTRSNTLYYNNLTATGMS